MYKRAILTAILVLGVAYPLRSLAEAAHTAQQEQEEQSGQNKSGSGQTTQTRQQIEATEEKVLGHDAHQKLEVLHVATESHPILSLSILGVVIVLAILAVVYFVRRKKNRS
ncbi:LPXTG cell wall anchor domain-containing protein [Candidatus Peregrinibacteria bacterium]|nr:LPXTG cell wall anchor domain-containing protein [Candidatus Peregrinibacteria bacterium]MBI3816175.1 LPXTG cell wall anchor domain-containing protein [Candidatus Peregrinibacteria bacterium]